MVGAARRKARLPRKILRVILSDGSCELQPQVYGWKIKGTITIFQDSDFKFNYDSTSSCLKDLFKCLMLTLHRETKFKMFSCQSFVERQMMVEQITSIFSTEICICPLWILFASPCMCYNFCFLLAMYRAMYRVMYRAMYRVNISFVFCYLING